MTSHGLLITWRLLGVLMPKSEVPPSPKSDGAGVAVGLGTSSPPTVWALTSERCSVPGLTRKVSSSATLRSPDSGFLYVLSPDVFRVRVVVVLGLKKVILVQKCLSVECVEVRIKLSRNCWNVKLIFPFCFQLSRSQRAAEVSLQWRISFFTSDSLLFLCVCFLLHWFSLLFPLPAVLHSYMIKEADSLYQLSSLLNIQQQRIIITWSSSRIFFIRTKSCSVPSHTQLITTILV